MYGYSKIKDDDGIELFQIAKNHRNISDKKKKKTH